jgi:DNA-directed RNA polymerase subunit M/transcription elongation factor TFIIS
MAKCSHGVYGDGWGCQQCHPPGSADFDQPTPVLPRSSADPLNADKTGKMETCPKCGNLRTYFSNECRVCHAPFPITDERGRAQGTANMHQAGVCPACGSAVHYETKKATFWECADCGEEYPASKRK